MVAATKGGARQLNQGAIDALRSTGASAMNAAELAGMSHAIVGVKGAQPSTAAEQIAPDDAYLPRLRRLPRSGGGAGLG